MEIRSLQNADIEEVRYLLDTSRPYVLAHHHYIYWMLQNYYPETNLVAVDQNKVIGYIGALPAVEKGALFIWQIVVDAGFGGKGIATNLLDMVVQNAKKQHIERIEFTIDKNNTKSHALFSGFAKKMGAQMIITEEYVFEDNHDYVYKIPLL